MTRDSDDQYDLLWSAEWGDQQRYGPVHRHQRRELLNLVSKLNVRTVLDVGCGSGENLASLAEAMPDLRLSGTDVSASALEIAKRRAPTVSFHLLDAQIETLGERFDLVMSNQVIEHLEDDVGALRLMAQRSACWVLVMTMRGRMRPSEKLIGHFRNYSDDELRRKAALAELEVVDIFGWGFPFYSPSTVQRQSGCPEVRLAANSEAFRSWLRTCSMDFTGSISRARVM